jgi:chemotaxis protein MotB
MSKRKKHQGGEPEAENAERWLLTYADMITLLTCFFIIMYSMSVVNIKKFNQVAIAIRSGFGGIQEGSRGDYFITAGDTILGKDNLHVVSSSSEESQLPQGQSAFSEMETWALTAVKRQLAVLRLDRVMDPVVDVPSLSGNKFKVILTDQLFFEKDSAQLTGPSLRKLAEIGAQVKNAPYNLMIDGYSGAVGTNSAYASSWQLASERARVVVEALVDNAGVNPRRLSLRSYGEWTPYGASRQIMLTKDGQWREYSPVEVPSRSRAVISVVLD